MMRNFTTLYPKMNASLLAAPFRLLLVGLSLALLAGAIRAQDYSLQAGSPTFNTALPVEMGFLDVANGNLHLERPLGSFPQRGSRPFVARLVYDSRIWQVVGTSWHPSNVPGQGGWRFLTNVDTGGVSYSSTTVSCLIGGIIGGHWYPSYNIRSNFSWTDPNGTTHVFPAITEQPVSGTPCSSPLNQPTGGGYANDSTGFYLSVTNYSTVTIYGPDGSQVYPTVEDTNGNYFSTDSHGNVKDTLGRVPVTTTTNCNGNSNQTCYDVLNSQGSTSRFTVTTTTVSVSTAFGQSGVTEFSGSLTVVQKITLPDGTFYQFGYDSYGELNSITLPTLGQVTFGYTNYQDSFGNKNRWATSRVSGGGTWSYTPAVISTCGSGQVGCQQKVTVTKPSGDNVVYTFTLNNGAWVGSVQSYTGTISPGNLLSTLSLTWNMSNSCNPTPCSGNNNIQTTAETLTLPVPGGSSISKTTQMIYDASSDMNLKSIQQWKFYSGSQPATPDRQTDITYKTNYGHIINRPLQSTTCVPTGTPPSCTGSTNILAQTNFTYDDSGTLSNTSPATGIQNHDDAAYGISNTTRGNVTSIKGCTNLTACSSNFVQTQMTYDTTGQRVSVNDPDGNITNFGYADKFYKDIGDGPANPPQTYSVSTPTNAYLTSVAPPLIPATAMGYFYGTGQQALVTNANGQTTYLHFFDSSFSRPTSIVLPNGGWLARESSSNRPRQPNAHERL